MPSQTARQLMIENLQDSLRLVRHLMNFELEEFAEALGVTAQTVSSLETKKIKMTPTQYVAVAALAETYFAQNSARLEELKNTLDGEGKNYGADYETSFRDNSLLKRWFEDFVDFAPAEDLPEDNLWDLARDYRIFLDAETLNAEGAEIFTANLTRALKYFRKNAIVPLRSIEQLEDDSPAFELIKNMKAKGVVRVHGEDTDPDFRETILTVFERFRSTYRLCLITPDAELVQEIFALNDSDDFQIAAAFLNDENELEFYEEENSDAPEEDTDGQNFNGWEEI